MTKKKPDRRARKEKFAAVYGIAEALMHDYYHGGNKVFEPLEVFHCGRWIDLGRPRSWLSAADWRELTANDKTEIFACEICDRLEKFNFKIQGRPANQ